jgi:hypothetical protein
MKKEIIITALIFLVIGLILGISLIGYNSNGTDNEEDEQYLLNEAKTLEKMRLCLSDGLQKIHTEKNNCLSSCWGHQNLEEIDNVCVQCLKEIETANSIIENCIVQTGL